MDLGKRVKALREDAGWKQVDVSKKSGVSRARISQIETNALTDVKGDTLVSLAKAFDLSVEQLMAPDVFTMSLFTELRNQPKTNLVKYLL